MKKIIYTLCICAFQVSSIHAQFTFDSSTPAALTNSVALDATITLTFSENTNSGSVTASTIVIRGRNTGIISGSFSGGGTSTVVFTPTNNFESGEIITVTLTTGVQQDISNTALSNPQSFIFTTKSSLTGFNPSFTVEDIDTTVDGASSVFVADLDGDGDLDIVTASNADDTIAWYENDGAADPGFTKAAITTSAEGAASVFVADLDNDGDLDIVSVSDIDDTTAWYENDGAADPGFTTHIISTDLDRVRSVFVIDLDSDGDLDILTSSYGANTIAWYENDGATDPSFTLTVIVDNLFLPTAVYAADLDNDGDQDIISNTRFGPTVWYENDGAADPSFTSTEITATFSDGSDVSGGNGLFTADMDNDGDMDIISLFESDDTILWYENDGATDPTFTAIEISNSVDGPVSVYASDIDNDGDMDLISALFQGMIVWFENDGAADPGFSLENIVTTNVFGARSVFVADLDGDSDLDIAAAAREDDTILWIENSTSTTWDGSESNDWGTATNWSNDIPNTNSDVVIPMGLANYPTASAAVSVKSVSLASSTSLIAQSTFAGSVTYHRTIPTAGTSPADWYLISSPVIGQDIDTFVSAEGLATGTGNNLGLGAYNNTTKAWDYYQNDASGSGNFISGDGRAISLAAAGDISFTGTLNTDGVGIPITLNANGYNLIGNPYTSYIPANTNANATNNILDINTTSLIQETVWFWNASTDTYDEINQTSASMFIAPAQGFFVLSNGTNTFNFTEAMQSHQSSDTFQRGTTSTRPEINLVMTNGTDTRDTDIFYIDGTTTGWDNGYDSSIFGGVANEFSVYTHLVSDSEGQDLGIQSLPNSGFEEMVIPVGINAVSGTQITLSATVVNFPEGIKVYLEDKEDNSFTTLSDSSNFSTTLPDNLRGIGRFYLHTNTNTLSIDDPSINKHVSIYPSSRENLHIVGVQNGKATIQLYNILGKEVLRTSFEGQGVNDITLPILSSGVYIIQLVTEKGTINKKINLE